MCGLYPRKYVALEMNRAQNWLKLKSREVFKEQMVMWNSFWLKNHKDHAWNQSKLQLFLLVKKKEVTMIFLSESLQYKSIGKKIHSNELKPMAQWKELTMETLRLRVRLFESPYQRQKKEKKKVPPTSKSFHLANIYQ